MTGLIPESDRIIEIATIITNTDLQVVAEGPVLAIYQTEETLLRAWMNGINDIMAHQV